MSDGQSSLTKKFAVAAGKAALFFGLSFVFGIAVDGLIDYHLWHDIPELKPVIQDTSWVKDALRADVFFGHSFVDGVIGFFGLFSDEGVSVAADQANSVIERAMPQVGGADF